MQSLVPGYSLTNNLLLTEELPAPPGATYQVWFALNVQLGRIVIIKVHSDGRIEPLEETPSSTNFAMGTPSSVPPMPSVPGRVTPAPSVPIPPAPDLGASAQPGAKGRSRLLQQATAAGPAPIKKPDSLRTMWVYYALGGIALIGLLEVGYWFWLQQDKTGASTAISPAAVTVPVAASGGATTAPEPMEPAVSTQANPGPVPAGRGTVNNAQEPDRPAADGQTARPPALGLQRPAIMPMHSAATPSRPLTIKRTKKRTRTEQGHNGFITDTELKQN